jgi:hypothetical protein
MPTTKKTCTALVSNLKKAVGAVFRHPNTPLPGALIAQATAVLAEANDNENVRDCADDIRGRLRILRTQYRLPEDVSRFCERTSTFVHASHHDIVTQLPIGAAQAPEVQAAPVPVEEQIADLRQRQIANENQVWTYAHASGVFFF